MKKLIYGTLFLASVGIGFTSCEKEEVSQINSTKELNYSLDQIPLVKNVQDVNKLMLNSADEDAEKLNIYLYELEIATRELIKDQNFNQIIVDLASESEAKTAYFSDLKDVSPEYYKEIDLVLLKKNLSIESIERNMTHAPILPNPEFPETAEIEKYIPGIFVPNLDILDSKKQPIISACVVADCSAESELEDQIIAHYFEKDGSVNEILISEETSLKTSNPLFLLAHAVRFGEESATSNRTEEPSRDDFIEGQDRINIDHYDSKEIKIKTGYRYETGAGNNSEFCIQTYRVEANPSGNGIIHWIYNASGWKKIDEVKVSEINTLLTRQTLHSGDYNPIADNRVYWNTFERDWYRPLKNLGKPIFDGTTVHMGGNMRYSGDWYAWIPSTVGSHSTPFIWFQWNSNVNFSSWKSDYYIHRVL